MQTVGQLIREHRETLGMTLTALANEAGATKSYLSMIENHRVANPPSRGLLVELERVLHITDGALVRAADWENTPEDVRSKVEALSETAKSGRELAEWLKKNAQKGKTGGKDLDKAIQSGEFKKLIQSTLGKDAPTRKLEPQPVQQAPLINKVAAGYPTNFTDLDYPARVADEYVMCPDMDDRDVFAARVVGDSMMPEYREGDVVVFSPKVPVADGSDCFVRLEPDHDTTFKRVYFEADSKGKKNAMIRLQPLNPKFPPTLLKREQVSGLYRAMWRMQKL
ncbi:MAG: XRE family transcriptional regulator [Phycisphaeraceae bacterium]